MKKIKYSYCIDKDKNLVHIKNLTDATRHDRQLFCLECGQQMVANLGTKKAWYFSHKADTACDGESYLHKLAKRRIREKFISGETFPITFSREVLCVESKKCPGNRPGACYEYDVKIPLDLKKWKEDVLYDTCQEEVKVGEFRPDLLLSCKNKPLREYIFIEIYKTHQSTETKTDSKYKIIETTKIKNEDDIDDIIKRGFVEGENCTTSNFNPRLPIIRKKNIPINRFVLFQNGVAKIYRALDYAIYCDKLYQKSYQQSAIELNFRNHEMDIWGDGALTTYELGLTYLLKKGWAIKNCILCKYNRFNEYHMNYICILYKTLGLGKPSPPQTTAKNCVRFEINQRLLKIPLSELEKDFSEIPSEKEK